jgi:hypothetical protein
MKIHSTTKPEEGKEIFKKNHENHFFRRKSLMVGSSKEFYEIFTFLPSNALHFAFDSG